MSESSGLDWQVSSVPGHRRSGVRRDRHGRGSRGVLLLPMVPRYRSRRSVFDDLVIYQVRELVRSWPALAQVEYCVEDVPPSDPAPWESQGVVLGRAFPADHASKLPARVVIYRHPCRQRAADLHELRDFVRAVLVEQSAQILGRRPDELDPH